MFETLKERAEHLKLETYGLYLAARDPRTPWYVRLLVAAIVAYVFSPVDLIPDFIPVIGFLDDLILVPLGIALAIRLTPDLILDECRTRAAREFASGQPISRSAGVVVVLIWIGATGLLGWWGYNQLV